MTDWADVWGHIGGFGVGWLLGIHFMKLEDG